ncbi:unnamed protein product [Tenebrio molitor]|nr:unnamed protein product [Tenebrio molitor]
MVRWVNIILAFMATVSALMMMVQAVPDDDKDDGGVWPPAGVTEK